MEQQLLLEKASERNLFFCETFLEMIAMKGAPFFVEEAFFVSSYFCDSHHASRWGKREREGKREKTLLLVFLKCPIGKLKMEKYSMARWNVEGWAETKKQ